MQPTNTLKTAALPLCLFVLLLFACSSLLKAQTTADHSSSTDEQAIRNLVAQQNEGKNAIKYTDNRIFVSGAYPMPIIGKQMSAENQQAENRMKTERLNFKGINRIERLVIAQGGDMAYEFGYADLSWDTPDKKHTAFESTYLRVWRKLQDEWKVDVFFARPNKE